MSILLCFFVLASGRNCTEDYEYNPFSNTCFRIITIQKVWENAKEFCEADGEYLATFHSLESFSWFLNLRKTNPGNYTISIYGNNNSE